MKIVDEMPDSGYFVAIWDGAGMMSCESCWMDSGVLKIYYDGQDDFIRPESHPLYGLDDDFYKKQNAKYIVKDCAGNGGF